MLRGVTAVVVPTTVSGGTGRRAGLKIRLPHGDSDDCLTNA
jgi:hypothetical protein